ncbi:MAG: hypothetical protein WD207_01145 [Xanthobacteraceae bacterium]
MRNTLLALTAAAAFGAIGFAAAPASAAPIAPAHLAAHKASNQFEQVRHVRRDIRRHVRRDHRRHFWAAGPWAFGPALYHNCFRIGHGFVCYY